jgi:hypothetical protein
MTFLSKPVIFAFGMKFYDKYPQLKNKEFLTQVLTNTVFSTMALEDQEVPRAKVEEIVLSLLNEKELKGGQFFTTST